MMIEFITNRVFNSRTYYFEVEKGMYWLVDCGDIEKVMERLPEGSVIEGVLFTHIHFDHIYGIETLMKMFPDCVIYTNEAGRDSFADSRHNFSKYHTDFQPIVFSSTNIHIVGEGSKIVLRPDIDVVVYETPGHDTTCLTYMMGDYLFTGDSYIPGTKVITTFPLSDKQQAKVSLERIKQLSEGKTILPGHTLI